jgi:hypothetical protein
MSRDLYIRSFTGPNGKIVRSTQVEADDRLFLGPPGNGRLVRLGAEELNALFEVVSDKTYPLISRAAAASVLSRVTLKTESGECTVALHVNGVAVPGVGGLVNDQGLDQALDPGYDVPEGARVTLVVTGNASALDLEATLAFG